MQHEAVGIVLDRERSERTLARRYERILKTGEREEARAKVESDRQKRIRFLQEIETELKHAIERAKLTDPPYANGRISRKTYAPWIKTVMWSIGGHYFGRTWCETFIGSDGRLYRCPYLGRVIDMALTRTGRSLLVPVKFRRNTNDQQFTDTIKDIRTFASKV